ncbi:MAG: hypothetical protein PHS80_02700 [Methanothrix sp.]|nr:hypothetical protein [Methanothrix sp.]
MRTNGNTDMQPTGAALMRGMNIEDEAQFVEIALQRANRDMILVQDSDSRICWHNGQLLRHQPGAGKGWTCRKITPLQLVKLAPARRVIEVLGEAC